MAKQRNGKRDVEAKPEADKPSEWIEATVEGAEPAPVDAVLVDAEMLAKIQTATITPIVVAEPRPSYEDFRSAAELGMRVEISLVGRAGPVLKAGYIVMREPRIHSLRVALEAGESHLRALANDPDLKVRILD